MPASALPPDFLQPSGAARGIFFLHIPKTAGSFVVSLFQNRYGEDACAPFMEQAILEALQGSRRRLRRRQAEFASAHIRLHVLRTSGLPQRYEVFTLLRDPLDRLVSHLNWIDRFNHGLDRESYKALAPDLKRLVQELARVDPDSRPDLTRFFRLDGLAKARMLFNLQAAMLFSRTAQDILHLTDLAHLTEAQMQRRLEPLAFCATLDQFKAGVTGAGLAIPVEDKVNGARSRRFRRSDVLARVAARYVEADRRLFDLVAASSPDLTPALDRLAMLPHASDAA